MKKLELVSTKNLIGFDEFVAINKFQFPNGVYQSWNSGIFHLSFINPILETILSRNSSIKRVMLPENFVVEKHRLVEPASCIEMASEVGFKRRFSFPIFLGTVWSLLNEQGENTDGFINKNCLFLLHVAYPDGVFVTASMMLMNIGAYHEYSINIGDPKIYEDTWSVNSSPERNTYLLVPVEKYKAY